jgi:hypothetical protein
VGFLAPAKNRGEKEKDEEWETWNKNKKNNTCNGEGNRENKYNFRPVHDYSHKYDKSTY